MRVLLLTHPDLLPPDSADGFTEQEVLRWRTERDVLDGLKSLGHQVTALGVDSDLTALDEVLEKWQPHIVFNLLMSFRGEGAFEPHIVSYLELLGVPYTGCNPRGLLLSRDKSLAKRLLMSHGIPTPRFAVLRDGHPTGRGLHELRYPVIVKPVAGECSRGIAFKSVVHCRRDLLERAQFLGRNPDTAVLAEEYVHGRELTIGVLGNRRPQALPVWETDFGRISGRRIVIATEKLKWSQRYRRAMGVATGPAKRLAGRARKSLQGLAKQAFRTLGMTGFARFDFRLDQEGHAYLIDANANPDIDFQEDFVRSAEALGIDRQQLLSRILHLGLRYKAPFAPSC